LIGPVGYASAAVAVATGNKNDVSSALRLAPTTLPLNLLPMLVSLWLEVQRFW